MNSTNPFKELEEKPPSHRLCSFQTSASSPLLSASSPPFFVHDQFSYSSFFNLPPLHFRLKLKAYFPYMTHISCIHPLIPKVCQFCISLELLRINFSLWDSSHHDSKTLQLQRVLTLPFVLFVSHCNLYPIQCFFFFLLIPSGKSVLSTHKKGCLLLARPQTISTSSFSCMKSTLPTLTQITDLRVCLSSHAMQLLSSLSTLLEEVGIVRKNCNCLV